MEQDHLLRLKALVGQLHQRHGRETPIDGLLLTSVTSELGPVHTVYRPSLCVVLQGAKTSAFGDSAYRYEAGKCLIASMSVPIKAHIHGASADAPYIAFSLQLDPAMVADLLLEAKMEEGDPGAVRALAVHTVPLELFDPLERMLHLCDRPRDREVLAPLIQREIVWLLLHSPMAPALRQIALADSRMSRIGRAITDIRRNYAAPLSIPMLARIAGMSPATFHRHFKAVTAMTPVQYQCFACRRRAGCCWPRVAISPGSALPSAMKARRSSAGNIGASLVCRLRGTASGSGRDWRCRPISERS